MGKQRKRNHMSSGCNNMGILGLVLAEGEEHKRQRKMMNPAFTHNNIKEMVPTFIRVVSTLKECYWLSRI
ncbi:unnamed protein product [Rhizophagus irregularis]|nr:unnamed protein product [Rhizophagus irregularis]